MIIGRSALLRTIQEARCGPLREFLSRQPQATGSIYSSMQCMLKGVCSQCLQWQIDPATGQRTKAAGSGELLTLKLRYKRPDGDTSKLLTFHVKDRGRSYAKASDDFKFAASVAAFGMILRDSPHKGSASFDGVLELADEGRGEDRHGYRAEFLDLVAKARALSADKTAAR